MLHTNLDDGWMSLLYLHCWIIDCNLRCATKSIIWLLLRRRKREHGDMLEKLEVTIEIDQFPGRSICAKFLLSELSESALKRRIG